MRRLLLSYRRLDAESRHVRNEDDHAKIIVDDGLDYIMDGSLFSGAHRLVGFVGFIAPAARGTAGFLIIWEDSHDVNAGTNITSIGGTARGFDRRPLATGHSQTSFGSRIIGRGGSRKENPD